MAKIKQAEKPRYRSLLRRLQEQVALMVRLLANWFDEWARWIAARCDVIPDATDLAEMRPQNAAAATQLEQVASTFSGIAETVREVQHVLPRSEENFNWVVDTMQEHLCNKCTRRAACWSSHYNDLMDGLFHLKPILAQTQHVEVEHFSAGLLYCVHPVAMASEMTRAYALYQGRSQARAQTDALRSALHEQYGAVAQALESLSGQLSAQGVPEHYKTRRVVELFTELDMPPSECAVTQEQNGSLRVAVTLPRICFTPEELTCLAQDVSRVCHRHLAVPQKLSCRGISSLIFQEEPFFQAVFGVAALPAKGGISGDAVQQFCHLHTAEMILCDGMGTGCPAAVDGNLAAELTARLRRAGFSAQTVAQLVNVALSLKSDEESSATLDMLSVDLYTGATSIFKAGAAPSFVVQHGTARAVGAQSLPVGILGEVKSTQHTLSLSVGDYAVLVSDGLLVGGTDWVLAKLTQAAAEKHPPEQVAAALAAAARGHAITSGAVHLDDITVAVLQLARQRNG